VRKDEPPLATARRTPRRGGHAARRARADAIRGHATPAGGELVALLQRLRDELNAFLDDPGVRRESSGNRESSRRV
jgi:hypothetical protein